MSYLEENSLLPVSQNGFRRDLETENTLVNLTKEIYNNLDT